MRDGWIKKKMGGYVREMKAYEIGCYVREMGGYVRKMGS